MSARRRRSKKGRTYRNSDARRRRFHRSNSVRSVRCEEQEKTWTEVWGANTIGGADGAKDWFYPFTIGMEGAIKG